MEKIKIIILVGPDGAGKTTLKREIESRCNYKYFVIDRLTDSIVYNKLYNRTSPSESQILMFEYEFSLIADVNLVYVYADVDTLLERLKYKNESGDIAYLKKTMRLFDEYLKKTYFKKIKINTCKLTISDTADIIIKTVDNKNE